MGNAWERVPEPKPERPSVEGQDPRRRDDIGGKGRGGGLAYLRNLVAAGDRKSR